MSRKWKVSVITSDAAVCSSPCILKGFTVLVTTANGKAVLYDNTAASGTKIGEIGMATQNDGIAVMGLDIRCETGIYVNLTTATVAVYYVLED